jgi:hypothetical protein
MRVKLCALCPYTPRDLAGHYDPEGPLHLCAKCDGEQQVSTHHYPRKTRTRQNFATVLHIPGTAQPSVARSVTERLASSGTTSGDPPSVQKSAPTASRPVKRTTEDGYVCFKRRPDDACNEHHTASSQSSGFRSKEVAQ